MKVRAVLFDPPTAPNTNGLLWFCLFSLTRGSGIWGTLVVRSDIVRVSSSVVKQLVLTIPRKAYFNKTAIPTATESSGTAIPLAAVTLALSVIGRGFCEFLELNRTAKATESKTAKHVRDSDFLTATFQDFFCIYGFAVTRNIATANITTKLSKFNGENHKTLSPFCSRFLICGRSFMVSVLNRDYARDLMFFDHRIGFGFNIIFLRQ